MTGKNIIPPDGYIWLQRACQELLDIRSEKYAHANNEPDQRNSWALDCIEETEKKLRTLLLGQKLKAVYYDDEGLREIPCGLWRKDDYGAWIRRGEIFFADGRREDVFVDAGEFESVKAVWIEKFGLPRTHLVPAATGFKSKYVPPYITMMLEAVEKFDITNKIPKKQELIDHFQAQALPDGSRISENHAKVMATFCRPVEAMKGGE